MHIIASSLRGPPPMARMLLHPLSALDDREMRGQRRGKLVSRYMSSCRLLLGVRKSNVFGISIRTFHRT